MLKFEEWLEINSNHIRKIQDECEIGHAEEVEWWDTRVFIECYGCGRIPGEEASEFAGCSACEFIESFPECECNALVLYKRALKGEKLW